jgi:periplasmic divalent cation tolerance protein
VSDLSEVVITAPDPDWLRELARQLVSEGLAASAHIFPIGSVYRWQGEVIERSEGRVSLHTRTELIPAIVERVKSVHPYEVPGISARPIIGGNPEYLTWMANETKSHEGHA